jgi:gliding motility-associated-like protein
MNTRFPQIFSILLLLASSLVSAQYIQVNDNYSAQQLVDALIGNSCASASNVVVNGWTGSSGGSSFGYFTAGTSGFPFENGIVLSTGFATSATGPNNSLLSEGIPGWPGDADLEAALGVGGTVNATILEFDFIPFTNHISFDYIFSSEQYLTSITSQNQCNYTDGFAFLLKEAGAATPYQNLAVVPGTDIPVKVNTVRGEGVCPSANEEYFGGFNGSNHPTNFNGQTVILTAEADVVAGVTYHIKLVVADQGNNLYDSAIFLGGGSFNSTTDLGADRLIATDNPACVGETIQLNATTANAAGYEWFKDGVAIPGATSPTYGVTEEGEYSVEVQLIGNCISEGRITIEYAASSPAGSHTLLQCDADNDGFTVFNLTLANPLLNNNNQDLSVTYYLTQANAEDGVNAISNTLQFQNTVVNQQIYARVTNQFGCYTISTLTLTTSANALTNPAPLTTCDTDGTDDGFFVFDLTVRDSEILDGLPEGLQLQYFTSIADALSAQNPITTTLAFTNIIPNNQTLYARIINGSDCYSIVELQLVVFSFGSALQDESVTLCSGELLTLTAPDGFISYSWNTNPVQNTRTIIVSQPGIYTVTVVDGNGCSGTKTFTVTASGLALNAVVEINDFAGNLNSITILPEGIGSYEFSLDGVTYYPTPVFTGLQTGEYTVYIRDINGCGPVYTKDIYILDYPKFFTPNGDGINDVWRIPFLNQYPQAVVNIFDRYGKVVAGFSGRDNAWDGTLNGELLPSTDYWFVIQLGTGRTISGHFAMMR